MMKIEKINCSFHKIPFKSILSFEFLLAELNNISSDPIHPLRESAASVLEETKKFPFLKKSIKDRSVLIENQAIVDKLMAFVFNPMKDKLDIAAAVPPFVPEPFFSTHLFKETIGGEHRKFELANDMEQDKMLIAVIYQAYLVILEKFYGLNIYVDIPFIFKLTDEEDKTLRYFKVRGNPLFMEVSVKGKVNSLSETEIKDLFDNSWNLDLWNEKIPLSQFEFKGFLGFTYIDITHEHVVSQLKSDLLDKNSIITNTGFDKIKEKVKALFGIQDLEFGLAAFNVFDSSINQNRIWRTIIPQSDLRCEDYGGTIYEKAYREKRMLFTRDFKKEKKDVLANAFLKKELRSHVVVPLMLENEIVGMIEFATRTPDWFNMVQVKRFHELFPVFALALRRSKEEWNDKVRAIIQQECTAIHSTVEWRFREAASEMLNISQKGEITSMEPIVFPDVVPIYGASDIRNSSIERNKAIQKDLSEHLSIVKSVLIQGMRSREMPLLNNLAYKIEKHMHTVSAGLKAGDEVSILDFIHKEIEPVFNHLKKMDTSMVEPVDMYFNKMDSELKVLYDKRKDFEDSLSRINTEVGDIIDQEQIKAQRVFPHYFEKYRTDGVEYNAYFGQSLVKDLKFDDIYLKNIRLWQLMTMVRIARTIRRIQPELKTKLDITQLVLVHSTPLSIAFRYDEKKFDVAGTYNIRYEITKKRIDKAVVKGSKERVTQVGKIAIIYSLAEEIDEYRSYINFLIAQGYLKDSFEYLELEDLQGASGLMALRVEVDFNMGSLLEEINLSEIEKIVG
jgi:hypothetical protein